MKEYDGWRIIGDDVASHNIILSIRRPISGYVLSREAMDRLVNGAFPNPMTCPLLGDAEDVNMGPCLFLSLLWAD